MNGSHQHLASLWAGLYFYELTTTQLACPQPLLLWPAVLSPGLPHLCVSSCTELLIPSTASVGFCAKRLCCVVLFNFLALLFPHLRG